MQMFVAGAWGEAAPRGAPPCLALTLNPCSVLEPLAKPSLFVLKALSPHWGVHFSVGVLPPTVSLGCTEPGSSSACLSLLL